MNNLNKNVQFVKGVGPKRLKLLNKLNIYTVEDLLNYFPRSYTDLSTLSNDILNKVDQKIITSMQVIDNGYISRPKARLSIFKQKFKVNDIPIYLVWFNQDYLKGKYKIGDVLLVSGTLKKIGREYQISSPICEIPDNTRYIGKINPVYKLTKGLFNNTLSEIIKNALETNIDNIEENIPDYIISRFNLLKRKNAYENIHFPNNKELLLSATNRFKFEEILILQLSLLYYKHTINHIQGNLIDDNNKILDYISKLPFKLTNAQYKVLLEIFNDMNSSKKMNRLVQGDVGSGKSIIAFLSMIKAAFANYQSVLIAPTEVLAMQHFESLKSLLKLLDLETEISLTYLTGSLKENKKILIKENLENGLVNIVIGTHALLEDDVKFCNLGLIITDEQHRFGVIQRGKLESKGKNPDVLVMSATPIPRTLALILHGDLDISIIDELPPGRKSIKTFMINSSMLDRMYNFVKKNIMNGTQVYIVCPMIEENDDLKIRSAEKVYNELKNEILKEFNIKILHGKMQAIEKEEVLNTFISGETDVLVSTTVIEVGVNVPNANIMIVYDADRFGLSQLHQLRGRVGRGNEQSYCILINDNKSEISYQRMKILENSNDGFKISEKDFQFRGSGDLFGTRQHGIPNLKFVNFFEDINLIHDVQGLCKNILAEDPSLNLEKNNRLYKEVNLFLQKLSEDNISLN